jgi:L-arabinose transport system substrate-binding protein
MNKILVTLAAAAGLALMTGCTPSASNGSDSDEVKIGFLVKDAQEDWFQQEWKFAQMAADEHGFTLITQPAEDAEAVMTQIDNLNSRGVKGLIICTPEVTLGAAVTLKTDGYGMKLFTVDDRFVDADGNALDTHYMGISARDIGQSVGHALHEEMTSRSWDPSEVGAIGLTFDEIATLKDRTEGAKEALIADGFDGNRIFFAPQSKPNIEVASSVTAATMSQHPEITKWLIFGNNDVAVVGAVRATEQAGLTADDVIACGINGSAESISEFERESPTAVWGTILLSPKQHGYDTATMMYKWIADGEEPARETLTQGRLITRDNYKEVLAEEGLAE